MCEAELLALEVVGSNPGCLSFFGAFVLAVRYSILPVWHELGREDWQGQIAAKVVTLVSSPSQVTGGILLRENMQHSELNTSVPLTPFTTVHSSPIRTHRWCFPPAHAFKLTWTHNSRTGYLLQEASTSKPQRREKDFILNKSPEEPVFFSR